MYNITDVQQRYLLSQPESGMGYQWVEILTDANERVSAVAYNAELVLGLDAPNPREQFESFAAGKRASGFGLQVREIRVLVRGEFGGRTFSVGEARAVYGAVKPAPAKDAPLVQTKGGEVSKRFTAFERDRRIRPDGSLEPGTYATTEEDARNVRTGRQAVARYALPNPTPAVNVFTIVPLRATAIQYGVVEPANGQPGGGVEVIFTNGTTSGTVSGPTKIPP